MTRILLILVAFIGVTSALLVLQQTISPSQKQANNSVTPSPTPLTPLRDPAAFEVSRAQTNLVQIIEPIRRPAIANAATTPIVDTSMRAVTSGVLANLGATATTPVPAQQNNDRSMTSNVLENLNVATEPNKRDLQTLIVQALSQGQSDAYIDQMINAAAYAGNIDVPAELVTPNGRVDTRTLLATLVTKSDDQKTSAYVSMLNAAASGGSAGTIESTASTSGRSKPQKYTVQAGDSLAAISYRFYGETAGFRQIFNANLDRLTSPDKIRIGQVLTIPVL